MNIDDIEIPAAKVKVQTFEELLALKLQEGDAGSGIVSQPTAKVNDHMDESDDGKPKR